MSHVKMGIPRTGTVHTMVLSCEPKANGSRQHPGYAQWPGTVKEACDNQDLTIRRAVLIPLFCTRSELFQAPYIGVTCQLGFWFHAKMCYDTLIQYSQKDWMEEIVFPATQVTVQSQWAMYYSICHQFPLRITLKEFAMQ